MTMMTMKDIAEQKTPWNTGDREREWNLANLAVHGEVV